MHKKTVIDFKELGRRLIFSQPIKELKTRELAEVREILQEVEDWQKKGDTNPLNRTSLRFCFSSNLPKG